MREQRMAEATLAGLSTGEVASLRGCNLEEAIVVGLWLIYVIYISNIT